MISKNSSIGITYQVVVVNHGTLKGCPVTRFMIRDIIQGLHGETITYWASVFENLDLNVGDSVRFIDIDNITVSYDPERKKVNHFFNAVVDVIPNKSVENDEQKGEN